MMPRKNCDVHVHAKRDKDGEYQFRMSGPLVHHSGGVERLRFNKHELEMAKDDEHLIKFKLHNEAGADIRFTTNLANVMWASKVGSVNEPCPSDTAHLPDEFFAEHVNDDQDELWVVNTNMDCELLAFRLNFVPNGQIDVETGQQYIGYDPICENQNGSFLFR
jgi:hypothetical protein